MTSDADFRRVFFLVPKLHLGALAAFRETPFRAYGFPREGTATGNGIASTIAFPNGVWERGN